VSLRGTRESGLAFLLPTYLFVATLATVMVIGGVKTALAAGHPSPVASPPVLSTSMHAASLWLLMRTFASRCTAMTGVEAVGNGGRPRAEGMCPGEAIIRPPPLVGVSGGGSQLRAANLPRWQEIRPPAHLLAPLMRAGPV
jgi:hypothetical protein